MPPINLSYILTTRNKLHYLKETLKILLNNVQEDEEIVIVDSNSTDGTKEYLEELYRDGKINQFISEPDKGEAHGWNKALLLAKGTLIKLITDDDAYYYPVLHQCKNFMLAHKEIDALGFEGFYINALLPKINIQPVYTTKKFIEWKKNKTPFLFCGISLLLRRSSIPLIGLFHSGFTAVDYEFTLRLTSLPVKLAWHTGFCYVNIKNEKSNSTTNREDLILKERQKAINLYLNVNIKSKSALKIIQNIKIILRPIKNILTKKKENEEFKLYTFEIDIMQRFNETVLGKLTSLRFANFWLDNFNKKNRGEFIYETIPEKYLGKSFVIDMFL